jgi:hypothetical protein
MVGTDKAGTDKAGTDKAGAGTEKRATTPKNIKKPEFIMPTKDNYAIMQKNNYTIKQLKEIAGHHKIKLQSSDIKAEMLTKIYNFFKLYDTAVVIQRKFRSYLYKVYNEIRGPARFNRSLCVNETDFFTMDDLVDIPYIQFYSFRDDDEKIYGFDIMSLYNLFDKGSNSTTNPYNRAPFPRKVKKNMLKLIRLNRLFNENMNVLINPPDSDTKNTELTQLNEPSIEYRALTVFHDMDILGNYTDCNWFLDLDHTQLVRFIIEMNDIWNYRANLTDEIKHEICPNYRELFRFVYFGNIHLSAMPTLCEIALRIIEMLVRSGINHDSKCLGTNYVLCALTLVSPPAAVALPWLYQSVL